MVSGMDSETLLLMMGNLQLRHRNNATPDAVSTPGVLRARFASAVSDQETPDWQHIAIFDFARDRGDAAAQLLKQNWSVGPVFDDRSLQVETASAITPRLQAAGLSSADTTNPLLFIVLTNPADGREGDYNEWYNRQHLPDVLAIPGFVAAQRFWLGVSSQRARLPWRYLAIYEVDPDLREIAFAEMDVRKGTERMPISDALASDRFRALYAITATS